MSEEKKPGALGTDTGVLGVIGVFCAVIAIAALPMLLDVEWTLTICLFLPLSAFLISLYTWRWSHRPAAIYRREARRKEKLGGELARLQKRLVVEVEALEKLRSVRELLSRLPTAGDILERLRNEGSLDPVLFFYFCRKSIHRYLLLKRGSPLRVWIDCWVSSKDIPSSTGRSLYLMLVLRADSPGWTADDAFQLAKKHQLEEYEARRERQLVKARVLQAKANELSRELGIAPRDFLSKIDSEHKPDQLRVEAEVDLPPETARAKLAKIRADIKELRGREAELESELLADQPADLPHRRAAGIPD